MRQLKLFALAGLVGLVGCDESSNGPEGTGQVTLQLATTPRTAAASASQVDALVISRVQVVARKIRLGQTGASCPTDDDSNTVDPSEECPVTKAGPLLLDPPVVEGAVTAFTADVPAGTYNRVRFQIHKPTGSNDQAFLQANPGFDGISIKVEGTYNLLPFTFTTALTAVQEIQLATPVDVVAGTPVEVTVLLDVKAWFADQAGTGLIDPTALTQQLRSLIEQNIRASFRAFVDANQDGTPD